MKNSTFVNTTIAAVLLAAAFTPAASIAAGVGLIWGAIKLSKSKDINSWLDKQDRMIVLTSI